MSDHFRNPYVGPRTFTESDRSYFFGRDREAKELLSLVISEPVVLFYAQSGAGKSSLVRTCLIPDLSEADFFVLPVGRVAGTISTLSESADNIFSFNLLTSLQGNHTDYSELTNLTISDFLKTFVKKDNFAKVLIIDQFEEILYAHPNRWQERELFFTQLSQAINEDPLLWVVLVTREDYVTSLTPYAYLLPGQLNARYYMQQLSINSALIAIEKPAELSGRPFEGGVANKLADNLCKIHTPYQDIAYPGEYIEPVQLQIVCQQLWNNTRDQKSISLKNLTQLGNVEATVDAALQSYYEQALSNTIDKVSVSEFRIRTWFSTKLITDAGTRNTVYRGPEKTAGLDNHIVDALKDQFLLRTEHRGQVTWYELIHDRFINSINSSNQEWKEKQSFVLRAAQDWEASGRKPDKLLYDDDELQKAIKSTSTLPKDSIVRIFLDASRDAQGKRALEAAQARERDARRLKKEETRRTRWLGFFLLILFAAISFAVIQIYRATITIQDALSKQAIANAVSTYAVEQRYGANATSTHSVEQGAIAVVNSTRSHQAGISANATSTEAYQLQNTAVAASTLAHEEQETAIAASTYAANQKKIAEAESTRAVEQRIIAETKQAEAAQQGRLLLVQSLAFNAINLADLNYDTELAALLLRHAYDINETENGELQSTIDEAFALILSQPYFNTTLRGHTGPVNAIEFHSSKPLLASAGTDGTVRLWDFSGNIYTSIIFGEIHEGGATELHFQGDNLLVSAGNDGDIRVWNIEKPETPIQVIHERDSVSSIALAPDNNDLIAILADGTINLWELNNIDGGPITLRQNDNHGSGFHPAVFDNNDRTITVGNPDGTIAKWRRYEISPAYSLAFSEENWQQSAGGTSFVGTFRNESRGNIFGSETGQISFSAYSSINETGSINQVILSLDAHTSSVNQVVLFHNEESVVSASNDGTFKIWEISYTPRFNVDLIKTINGHNGHPITDVAVSANEQLLASSSEDGIIRLWHFSFPFPQLEGGAPIAINNSANGLNLATVQKLEVDNAFQQNILVYNLDDSNSHEIISEISTGLNGIIKTLSFYPNHEVLAIGGSRDGPGILSFRSADNMNSGPFARFWPEDFEIDELSISSNNQWIAVADNEDTRVFILPADHPTHLEQSFEGHNRNITDLTFSPSKLTLASASEDVVNIWYFDKEDDLDPQPIGMFGAEAVAFSPDGNLLATSGSAGLFIWQLNNLSTPNSTLLNPLPNASSLAFSPDGSGLVAVGDGIRWWDLNHPEKAPISLMGSSLRFEDVVFSPDGDKIIVATSDSTFLWPAPSSFSNEICDLIQRDSLTLEEQTIYLRSHHFESACPSNTKETNNRKFNQGKVNLSFWQLVMDILQAGGILFTITVVIVSSKNRFNR